MRGGFFSLLRFFSVEFIRVVCRPIGISGLLCATACSCRSCAHNRNSNKHSFHFTGVFGECTHGWVGWRTRSHSIAHAKSAYWKYRDWLLPFYQQRENLMYFGNDVCNTIAIFRWLFFHLLFFHYSLVFSIFRLNANIKSKRFVRACAFRGNNNGITIGIDWHYHIQCAHRSFLMHSAHNWKNRSWDRPKKRRKKW